VHEQLSPLEPLCTAEHIQQGFFSKTTLQLVDMTRNAGTVGSWDFGGK
jgi:hypothetical protein